MAWTCLSCVYAHIGHVTKSIMVPIQWLPPRGCHPGVVLQVVSYYGWQWLWWVVTFGITAPCMHQHLPESQSCLLARSFGNQLTLTLHGIHSTHLPIYQSCMNSKRLVPIMLGCSNGWWWRGWGWTACGCWPPIWPRLRKVSLTIQGCHCPRRIQPESLLGPRCPGVSQNGFGAGPMTTWKSSWHPVSFCWTTKTLLPVNLRHVKFPKTETSFAAEVC